MNSKTDTEYSPLMHQYYMRFPADLGMNRHWKDKGVIFAVRKVELLEPESFHLMGTHKTLLSQRSETVRIERAMATYRTRTSRNWLQRWPVVKMPIRWDLDDFTRLDGRHGLHPKVRGLGNVCLDPCVARVRCVVRLQIMMHERVVIHDTEFLKLRNQLFAGRPCWSCVAQRLTASELGQDINRSGKDIVLLFGRQSVDMLVSIAMERAVRCLQSNPTCRKDRIDSHLVSSISNFGHLLRKGLDTMGWREERGLDAVF